MMIASNSHEGVSKTFLMEVGVSRAIELTPKARKLYNLTRCLSKSLKKMKCRRRLHKKSINKEDVLDEIMAPLDTSVATFIRSQLRHANMHPKGRRFTFEDKVLGLLMHKQSGKAYKTLSKIFCFPSRKTIMALLSRIPISPGINYVVFENLKTNALQLGQRDRNCIVMFDEMSLEPHIEVNREKTEFEGFEDDGNIRGPVIADHVQDFMLKSLSKNWKQPIAVTFCRGTTKTIDLVGNLKEIISKCQKANLNVIATVSDQGTTNTAAINYLMINSLKERSSYYGDLKLFEINGKQIIHIYDYPHLLKGIRNNLLKRNLIWNVGQGKFCAKWSDIVTAYTMDNSSDELRSMPRITEEHINEKEMKKMTVKCATQIFSHSVASFIGLMARTGVVTMSFD